jgi:acyl-coenzyme A synthetase/AMP-(fatty) acid ligase
MLQHRSEKAQRNSERLGSVKTPKQVEVWPDLPRSKLGKILKNEVKSQLLSQADHDRH